MKHCERAWIRENKRERMAMSVCATATTALRRRRRLTGVSGGNARRTGRVERKYGGVEEGQGSRQRSVECEALVKIRFARYGRIHSPFYRVVAIDSRKKRSGRPAEFLGWYNPMTKETQLDAPNIRKWLDSTFALI